MNSKLSLPHATKQKKTNENMKYKLNNEHDKSGPDSNP